MWTDCQHLKTKNADFKLLLKNLSIGQCWAHNPQPQWWRLQWAVLPLLMELCSGLKAPCTTRQSLQPNLHGHLNPTLQAHNFFSYLDVPLWRHCSRHASPERSSTDQCGHWRTVEGGRLGQPSSRASQGRTRSNGCQPEQADSASKKGKAF